MWLWTIVGMVAVIATINILTNAVRIFGYLYIIPIQFSCYKLEPKVTTAIAIVCVGLILSVFTVRPEENLTEITITNRTIAVIGVTLSAYLGNRAIYRQHRSVESLKTFLGGRFSVCRYPTIAQSVDLADAKQTETKFQSRSTLLLPTETRPISQFG